MHIDAEKKFTDKEEENSDGSRKLNMFKKKLLKNKLQKQKMISF